MRLCIAAWWSTTALLALLVTLPSTATAQRRERPHRVELEEGEPATAKRSVGTGFFVVDAHQLDLDELNAALVSAGYLPIEDRGLGLGGGGWGTVGRWLVGGEGHGLMTPAREAGGIQTKLTAGYGMFDVGYLVVATESFDLFPMLGVGGGATVLDITQTGAFEFDGVLTDPGRGSRLRGASFALSLSMGAVFKAPGRQRRRGGEGGLAVGARAGYVFATDPDEWKLNDEGSVAGVPNVSFRGPFASLMIGGWGTK